ncbi:MAG: methyltransferase domain-containing protein, partial [Thermomicrobiales bacterium]|nr:methyltransferase domain-containing protein [Thermomicrobiales bacterium]
MTDLLSLRLEAWDRTRPGATLPLELNRHGVSERDASWKATTDHGIVAVTAARLPFASNTFDRLVLADLLEYARDERAVLAEASRVLVENGQLTILVPYLGPTTWLDGANWHRYLHDLTGSERVLPELAESGWRRRYRKNDLERLLRECGF